ncbi:maleylpyruvate isomerase family mycothiol-dependent enzyme [Mycolicibacterium fluoranthenivorans]|uniref:Maleylpyruvate isomerase family mycothiol-dependent enzyme n=1 Tax=Mycolicibacterium fluoranthenivorans TaxID=258505 RepID=A0A7G8PLM7_9MYCO|nr:maleylpyruvate isomerase family mycothiol-dependent enzyme [Mycolicibacterium fluoranthenivorans]
MARPVARTTCLKLCISGPFGGVVRRACTAALGTFLARISLRPPPWRRSVGPVSRPVSVLPQADVVPALFGVLADIDRLLDGLPEVRWEARVPLPAWRVRDVVAHVLGTELLLQGESAPPAEVSGLTHVRNPIGEMNEAWVQHLGVLTPDRLLARFREVTAKRRAELAAMSTEEWNAVMATPVGPESYGRFMRVRIFDCWMHEQDIREGLGRPSTDEDLSCPGARMALDEIAAGLARVVGKQGKAPAGSRVLFSLTGPLSREIRVAVDERAAVVQAFDGEPTTVIRMDGLQFTRRCGGRPLAVTRADEVEYEGDVEVGELIVANLAFVI